jgi:hypothetical protein
LHLISYRAGIIEEVGSKAASKWKKGDRVCALLPGGGYAQYCVIYADMAMPIPGNISACIWLIKQTILASRKLEQSQKHF